MTTTERRRLTLTQTLAFASISVPLVAYTVAGLIAGRYPLTRAAQAEPYGE